MRKLFVVTSDSTTADQDNVFRKWIEPRFNWWHWIEQTWLLVDENGTYTVYELRDKVKECFPGVYVMVLEVSKDGKARWAGFGAKGDAKNMFTWLKENWHH